MDGQRDQVFISDISETRVSLLNDKLESSVWKKTFLSGARHVEVNFLLRRAFSTLMQWVWRVQIVSVSVNTLDPISNQKTFILQTRFQTWHTQNLRHRYLD